jgi:hypothetical protein
MTKQNFKPMYAKNNPDWRIVYWPGGWWSLQQYHPLTGSEDRSRNQAWRDHHRYLSYDDAVRKLRDHDVKQTA